MSFNEFKVAKLLEKDPVAIRNWQQIFQPLLKGSSDFHQKGIRLSIGSVEPYVHYVELLQQWKSDNGSGAELKHLIRALKSAKCQLTADKLEKESATVEPSVWYYASATHETVFGREKQLNDLNDAIIHKSKAIILISGCSGMGKTFMVKKALWSCREELISYIWIDNTGGILSSMEKLFKQIFPNASIPPSLNEAALIKQCFQELRSRIEEKIVVVFDDVDTLQEESFQELQNLLEKDFLIIVISKYKLTNAFTIGIYVLELSKEEALTFIKEELKYTTPHKDDELDLVKLYDLVGGHPLALRLAAGNICTKRFSDQTCSIQQYVDENRNPENQGGQGPLEKIQGTVASTLQEIRRQYPDKYKCIIQVLHVLSNVNSGFVDLEIIHHLFSTVNPNLSLEDVRSVTNILYRFNIIQSLVENVINFSPALQRITAFHLKNDKEAELNLSNILNLEKNPDDGPLEQQQHYVTFFKNTCPSVKADRSKIILKALKLLIPKYARELAEVLGNALLLDEAVLERLDKKDLQLEEKLAWKLRKFSMYEPAINNLKLIYEHKRFAAKRSLGPTEQQVTSASSPTDLGNEDDNETQETRRKLAYLYFLDDQYENSLPLYSKFLEWKERNVQDPSLVLETKVNVANVKIKLLKFDDVEDIYMEAMFVHHKDKDENRSLVAFHSLGYFYLMRALAQTKNDSENAAKDYYYAKCIFKMVIMKRVAKTGSDNLTRLLDAKYNLARALHGLNRTAKAILVLNETIEQQLKSFGGSHRGARKSMNLLEEYKKNFDPETVSGLKPIARDNLRTKSNTQEGHPQSTAPLDVGSSPDFAIFLATLPRQHVQNE